MSWFVVATEVGGTAAADVGVTALGSEFGTTALFSELGAGGMGELMGLGSLGVGSGAQTMSGIPSLLEQVSAANLPVAQQITAAQQAAQTANLAQQIGQFGQTQLPQAFNPAVESFAAQASPYTVGAESITNTLPQVGESPTWEELAKEYEAGNNIAQATTQANPPLLEKITPLDAGPAVPQLNPINPVTVPSGLNPVEAAKALDTQTYNSLLQQNIVGQGINKTPPGILDQLGAKYNSLSGLQKLGVNIGGSMLAQSLLKPKAAGLPTQEKYSGPLSKFKYNKDAYTPLTTPQPTAYQPQYTNYRGYADGGLTALDAAIKTVRENPPTDYQNYYTPNSSPSTAFESYYAPTEIPTQYDYLQNPNPPQYATPVLQDDSSYANQSARTTNPVQAPVTLSFPQDPVPVADSGGSTYTGNEATINYGDYTYGGAAAAGGLTTTGGISHLGGYSDGGRMLKGPGDGMSDSIPATINNKQPARLANEEFVIPADVVSHLGNGSSDAGAKQLYKMMDKIRAARTGTKKQGKQINPSKYLPA